MYSFGFISAVHSIGVYLLSTGKNSLNLTLKKENMYIHIFLLDIGILLLSLYFVFFRWLNYLVVNFIDTRSSGFTYMITANYNVGLLIPK